MDPSRRRMSISPAKLNFQDLRRGTVINFEGFGEYAAKDVEKAEETQNKEEEEKKSKKQGYVFQADKISKLRLLMFIIYTASLVVLINLRINFYLQYSVNVSTTQYYLNEITIGYNEYQTINSSKIAFHDIDTKEKLIQYIRMTLIYGMYQDEKGNIPDVPLVDALVVNQFQIVTPLRIFTNRIPVKEQPENVHFPTRWDLHASGSDKTPYGKKVTFYYDEEQEGFSWTILIPFLSYKEALGEFSKAINNGYIDSRTNGVRIDFAIYNIVNKLLIIVKLDIVFSPTGRIEKIGDVSTTYVDFYYGSNGKWLLTAQIIFVLLFLFFLLQEITELYAQISNNFPKRTLEDDLRSKFARFGSRMGLWKTKLVIIGKGFLNHIQDPWNFLDLISLICSLYLIMIWLTLLGENTIRGTLDNILTLPDTEKIQVLSTFNHKIEQTLDTQALMNKFLGVNMLVLILKVLKYIASFSDRILDIIRIIVLIAQKIMPYIVLAISILLAYAYLAHLLYGRWVEEFSTYFTSMRYFFTNLHNNYDLMDEILASAETNLALVFHLLLIFAISFLLASMFSVYVIQGFNEYIEQKNKTVDEKPKFKDPKKSLPHPIWVVKKIIDKCADFWFSSCCFRLAYMEKKALRQKNQEKEMMELGNFINFDFNMNIEDEVKRTEIAKLNPIFQTDAVMRKTIKKNKIITVKNVWSSLGIFLAFLFVTLISLEHHRVGEAQTFAQSIIKVLKKDTVMMKINDTIRTVSSITDFERLQEVQDIGDWVHNLFQYFPYPGNVTLKNDGTFAGPFLASELFMFTDKIRITTRVRSRLQIDDEEYQGAGNKTFSELFDAGALGPEGEYKLPLIGKTGTVYNYTENQGYKSAGGYIVESSVEEFEKTIQAIYDDGIFDAKINSVVVDFPLFLIKTKNAFRVVVIFQSNPGSFVDTKTKVEFLHLNLYNSGAQYMTALLEVITLLWTIVLIYKIIIEIRKKNYHYNYWYSLHIENIPELIKEQRERKCPEFIRKIIFILDFECTVNVGIIFFVIISAIMWIYYFVGVQDLLENIVSFLQQDPITTNGDLLTDLDRKFQILFYLKITESLAAALISMKLLYYYSFFNKFQFLIRVMKRSLEWIPHMFVSLVFILMAFGVFIQLIRGTKDQNYTSFANVVAQQLQFLNLFETGDRTIFDKPNGMFVTLIFYIPWVLFVVSIVGNIFLGVVYNSIMLEKEEQDTGHNNMTNKEFLKITIEILKNKDTDIDQEQKMHFEATVQETKNTFKYHQMYEDFAELVVLAKNYHNDRDLWTAACCKNIIDENKFRKNLKKTFKDIAAVTLVDFNFEKHEHVKILTDVEKHSQFYLRLKYWNYFKYGRMRLLQFMTIFNRYSERTNLENMGDHRRKKKQLKTDETIKRYIIKLEAKISQNIQDLLAMKKKLYEYEEEKPLVISKGVSKKEGSSVY